MQPHLVINFFVTRNYLSGKNELDLSLRLDLQAVESIFPETHQFFPLTARLGHRQGLVRPNKFQQDKALLPVRLGSTLQRKR